MSTLTINLNEEYRIKIENGNEFHNSIFKDVYINATKNVVDIINQSEGNREYDDFNNIIAFTGERGKGKSSSMISFRDALINNRDENKHKDFFDAKKLEDKSLKSTFEILRNKKFAEIDIIDPSLFKGNESLFEIILAKMFSKFQDKLKEKNSDISEDVRRNLIFHFQKVFENLQIINSDRNELYKLETIEALSKLATSSNLRDCFKVLMEIYLTTFAKKDFLIIAIDDFDLNISKTYEMLEDIRQLLIQNSIVLLISFRKEQTIQSIIKSMVYVDNKNESEIRNRASKYFEKLFPHKHIIYLPSISEIKNTSLNEKTKVILKSNNFDENFDLKSNQNLNDIIRNFINKRLDLFILNYNNRQNFIIPSTLREIIELLNTVDYFDFNKRKQLQIFQKYLIEKINNNLKEEYVDLIHSLTELNKNLIKIGIFNKIYEQLDINDKEFFKDLYLINNPNNMTIGDVISIVEQFYDRTSIVEKDRLIFIDYLLLFFTLECITSEQELSAKFIYNGIIQKFRKENNKYRRDFFEFNYNLNQLFDGKKDERIIFIHSFINSYGKNDNSKYKQKNSNLFYKIDNNFSHGTFSPFAIFTNFKYLKENINQKLFNFISNEFKNEIIEYDDMFIDYLINDPLFAFEFINTISEESYEYKEKITDEFAIAYEHIHNGGKVALEKILLLNDNNRDRIINSFENFPLFKIWENEINSNSNEIKKEYIKIYNSSKLEFYLTDKMKKDILYYISEFSSKSFTVAKTTYFFNKIKNENEKALLLKEISNFKNAYFKKNVNNDEKSELLNNFIEYLKELIDGQSS